MSGELQKFFFTKSSKPKIPPNQLLERDVLFLLGCHAQTGEEEIEHSRDGDAQAVYQNFVDGKTFSFEIKSIQVDGQLYTSKVVAERANARALKITSLIMDNDDQPLTNPKEIFSVLNAIGMQARSITASKSHPDNSSVPHIYKNDPQFSPFRRFLTRNLPALVADKFC